MSRLPIRVRLTLAFALALALVLAATGAFLYLRLESSLDESIDADLDARANALSVLVARGVPGAGSDPEGVAFGERLTQVVSFDGDVVASSDRRRPPLVDSGQIERTAREDVLYERDEVRNMNGRVRLVAKSTDSPDGLRVVVVGTSLEDRDETLAGFRSTLVLVGVSAMLVMSALGYGLATAALRPVERMRSEAGTISAEDPGRRLPLPSSRDELRRLGETLNSMLDRLEAAIERERGFVADASHELRTPLAILKTELDVALRHPRTAEEYEGAVRSAAEEADRLVRLAEDLLVLARSDQGRLGIRPETVSAEKLLESVARRFGEGVTVHRPSNGLVVFGDEVMLEQALGNLVDNALRHGAGTARISAVAEEDRVELHVRDDGPGFPPAFLPHAFERFSRPDEARTGGGAGLGLALAKAVAEAHGGSAGALNRHVRGADVWISIPARPGGPGSPGSPR